MMVDSPPYAYSARTSRAGAALLCSPPRRASAGQPSPLDSPLLAKLSFPAFASSSHSAELGSPMVPAPRTRLTRRAQPTARPIPIEDDDDGSVFLSSPTHTPVKRAVSQRAALSPLAINPLVAVPPRTGAKRKPAPATSNGNTPVGRTPPTMTPLKTAGGPFALDRLAPLAAPSFVDRDRTPQTKADADGLLRSQTASMTRLRIGDRTVDDGLEFGTPEDVEKVVPSAVSPDGHVTKRRVRSRPVSTDLRDMILIPASPPPIPALSFPSAPSMNFFPSSPGPASPCSSSSSDFGSPRARRSHARRPRTRTSSNKTGLRPAPLSRHVSSGTMFFGPSIPQPQPEKVATPKKSPTVSQHASPTRPKMATRHSYSGADTVNMWNRSPNRSAPTLVDDDEEMFFSGPSSSSFPFDPASSFFSPPRSPPTGLPKKFKLRDSGISLSTSDEEGLRRLSTASDHSLDSRVPSASTSFTTAASSGSEFGLGALVTPLFGPSHGSGWPSLVPPPVIGEDGEEGGLEAHVLRALHQPAKPVSGAAISDGGQGKRAPGTPVKKVKTAFVSARPWQSAFMPGKIGLPFISGGSPKDKAPGKDKAKKKPRASMPAAFPGAQTTAGKAKRLVFARTESIASTADGESESEAEMASPSALRDAKYTGVGLGRPTGVAQRAKWLMRRSSSGQFESGSESTGSAGTPTRLAKKGSQLSPQPVPQFSPTGSLFKHLSGSGSRSGSTSSASTMSSLNSPTTAKAGPGQGKMLPFPPPRPLRHRQSSVELFRSSDNAPPAPFALTLAAVAMTPTGSQVSTPTAAHFAFPTAMSASPASPPRATAHSRVRMTSMCDAEARPGRFEREFIEVDEMGSGEFGCVYRVRRKAGGSGEWAVKKSGRFEGVRQRLRLREEVDVLKHLSRASQAAGLVGGTHPNVLGYVDSWEQDERLYIRTELCELGNLARFLWEFGRVCPRLDEGRVWKIFAELSSGLAFIHGNGVIHLDLKPANVFVTGTGRFKIGDFGMASLWPRPRAVKVAGEEPASFEREGDKVYMAAEVLQSNYGPAADVFSLGMIMLEAATNVVVPDQGEPWHRLRREDLSQVELDGFSPELVTLLLCCMREAPGARWSAAAVAAHPVVARVRRATDACVGFAASPLASPPPGFLAEVLGRELRPMSPVGEEDDGDVRMDLSP